LDYKALMLRVAGSVHRVILGTPRVGEHIRTTSVTEERTESFNYRQLNATFIKLAIHLGFIGFLAYWTFVLVGPFIPIIVWSVVLTVALYPVFDWLAAVLGGRRGLAATLITIFGLVVVIGPVTWLGLGLIDGLKTLIERLDSEQLSIPPPWTPSGTGRLSGHSSMTFGRSHRAMCEAR
jgi:predicted PurR-regulated permease PerM